MGILRLIGTILSWGSLLVVAGAAVGAFVVYSRLNSEVEKHVLAELQERYPDLDIHIGSAQIIENRGISVKDIEFSVPPHQSSASRNPSRKLLHIGELFIECPVTLQTLYQKNLRISRVIVRKPILRASLSPEGTFPELQLLAGDGDFSLFFPEDGKAVLIEVEGGSLLYDDARQPAPPLHLSNINFTVTPTLYDSEMGEQTQRISFKGSAEGDFFRRLNVEAEFLPETNQWQFTANCLQFDWSDELWRYLPQHPYFKERPSFQGRLNFTVRAVSDPFADFGCRFVVGGALSHGRVVFPHISRTITELSTQFEISNERIKIDNLTGMGDFARISASYVQEGLMFFGDERQQAELTVNLRDCRFDDELIGVLSPFLNDETEYLLAQYDYDGTADLQASLSCRNGKWYPKNVSIQIAEVGFAYKNFPYRVDRLAGDLLIDETALLRFHFKSKQDSPLKVEIEGRYTNIFEDAAGKVVIIVEEVPIDSKLLRALPLESQKVVHSLQPAGKLKARLIFELPPGDVPVNKQFDIALDQVSLRYDQFPYPLRDVTGTLNYNGTAWQFREVVGANGTAVIRGSGYLQPAGSLYEHVVDENAQEFVLHVEAEELPVDDQIMQALPHPEQRQLLQSLNVNGRVNLAAQIQYRTDEQKLNLKFQAVPRAGLSIYPDRFPYKIDNVDGEIRFENGRVFAETPLTGTHRNTKWQSGLDCRFNEEGHLVLRLAPLDIDFLQVDRELLDALPKQLQHFLESLQLTRPFNLSGGIEYHQSAQGQQAVHWNLRWILHQNNATLGFPVESIFGIVHLAGVSADDRVYVNGELNLDSLMAGGFQITSVRGPFTFDGNRLRLGTQADRLPESPARPLSGIFCDGVIRAAGLVVVADNVSYDIRADLMGADLAKIAQVVEPTAQKAAGKLNCINVHLSGVGTKMETVVGRGSIQLRDANIYGAPVMVQLLRELRIRETDPDAGMFSVMDVDFRLSGMQMFIDSVIFEGGAISLHGDGLVKLDDRQLDLTMRTRLGSRRMQIPLISDIVGGGVDQLIQLRITGHIGEPVVTRVAVPEVQKALQQIQGDEEILPEPPDTRSRLAPSRMFMRNSL